ncbi:Isoamylase 3 [Nymphaea thermarum]|nr:Isoamylase 3 [Nymphaea thermarum]
MILMGDEYGHTRYGNNNSYGHDTLMNHFQWDKVDTNLPAPDDFVRDGVPGVKATYNVAPYSSILLIAKS